MDGISELTVEFAVLSKAEPDIIAGWDREGQTLPYGLQVHKLSKPRTKKQEQDDIPAEKSQ